MDNPIGEFKVNQLPLIAVIGAIVVPIIIYYKLIDYGLTWAISIFAIVVLYEFWVIKSELNYPFKIYKDRLEGKLNGRLYKMNVSDINTIIEKNGYIIFYGDNLNPIVKVKSKPKTEDFLALIKNTFPDKFVLEKESV